MTKVMVIDDSAMMRFYLRRCLEKAGFQVDEWLPLSAMEIPARLESSSPDLVITDYQMAGCNGATVARMVQRSPRDIPVLVLTAFKEYEMEANLTRLGVKRILDKPISAGDLVQVVLDVLEDD